MSAVPQVVALLAKIESDVLADLVSSLLPALEAEANSLLPTGDQAVAGSIESMFNPALQTAFASLVAKIPAA